jgi:hypothetical protein
MLPALLNTLWSGMEVTVDIAPTRKQTCHLCVIWWDVVLGRDRQFVVCIGPGCSGCGAGALTLPLLSSADWVCAMAPYVSLLTYPIW